MGSKQKSTTPDALSSTTGGTKIGQSNKKRKAELRTVGTKRRSQFPKSPRHGKHVSVQGDPNTIGFQK